MLLKRFYLTISLLIQPLKLLIYLYIAFYLYATILLILVESSQKHVGQAAAFNLPTFFFLYILYIYIARRRPHKADILIEYVFNLFIYISLINRRFFILYNLNRIHLIYLYIKYLYISYVLFHRGYSIIFFVIFYYISI